MRIFEYYEYGSSAAWPSPPDACCAPACSVYAAGDAPMTAAGCFILAAVLPSAASTVSTGSTGSASAAGVADLGSAAPRPFPSMVFMENNTWDGPRREGLNFTLEQEHVCPPSPPRTPATHAHPTPPHPSCSLRSLRPAACVAGAADLDRLQLPDGDHGLGRGPGPRPARRRGGQARHHPPRHQGQIP